MRRIHRDVQHEELVKFLTSGTSAIFSEIWRLLLFAAALGTQQGKRRPIRKSDGGKALPENYFSAPGWRGFLYLISISETENSEILKNTSDNQEILISAFEEYANEGLFIIQGRLKNSAVPLEEITSLLLEVTQSEVPVPDLDNLI